MKAVLIRSYGGREVLELADIPKPAFGDEEILVRVKAAGVNPVDWKIREGLFQGRMPCDFPIVLGWDMAGVVEETGKLVTGFKPGDEVFGYCRKDHIHDGTYAEFITVEPRHVALKPKNITFQEAAAIPLAALTGFQALFESLKILPNEKVLIHAGAGGVGHYAIQLACNEGAHVIATAGATNHDFVKRLGAHEVIDYTQTDFVQAIKAAHREGIDAVFDTVGGDVQVRSLDVLKRGGRLTSILALDETRLQRNDVQLGYVFVRPDSDQLRQLASLVVQQKLKVYLAGVFPLEDAARAHEQVESKHTRGKVVLKVSS